MCGIWGISYGARGAGEEELAPSEFARIMFPAIIHRGPHAYGWMYKQVGDDTIHVQKFPGRADTGEAAINMAGIPDNLEWLVCHVRWFTHGSPENNLNNHPIPHGRIVGVHNGVIRNYAEVLAVTGREDGRTEVDSEAIFAAINKWGHRKGLRKVAGDMVAVYANREAPEAINIARSYNRPLVLTRTPAGSLVFASEERVINSTKIKHGHFTTLLSNRLIRVRTGRIVGRVSYRAPEAPSAPQNATGAHGQHLRGRFDWSRPHHQESRPVPSPNGKRLSLEQQMRQANVALGIVPKKTAPTDGRNLRDHDTWNGYYYLEGRLLTEEEYLVVMADELGLGDDS